jgi:diguanylate cyclase (GGDEF)-like protein
LAVAYTQTISMDMIVSEIETLLDWQNDVLRQCLFPAAQIKPADPHAPSALLDWCKREQEKNILDAKFVDRMTSVHSELSAAATRAIQYCQQGNPLTVDLYDALEHQCEAFATHIRRLQQVMADSAVGVDAVTGLRTVAGMRNDIKREQDRYDRKGTSFSIAAVEIDRVHELQQLYDRRTMEGIYAHIARVMTATMRSFDDAYFLGRGEYIIVLKHLDFVDACIVMDRLRAIIKETPYVSPSGQNVQLTASFGITEAMLRDTAELGVEHAQSALQDAKVKGDCVIEYKELSGLARYAQDIKQNS